MHSWHPHPRIPNCRLKICTVFDRWLIKLSDVKLWIWRADCIYFVKKNVHINGLIQFSPVLFKGQMYFKPLDSEPWLIESRKQYSKLAASEFLREWGNSSSLEASDV